MNDFSPIEKAIDLVSSYVRGNRDKSDPPIPLEDGDVYVVWFTYVLGGWKALVSTTIPDNMYYEVTYDKVKQQTYLAAWVEVQNIVVPD